MTLSGVTNDNMPTIISSMIFLISFDIIAEVLPANLENSLRICVIRP